MSGLNQIAGNCNCGSGVVCATCSPASIPNTLTVTDSLGTYTATWNGSTYWVTPILCSNTVSPVAGCTGGTASCVFSSNSGRTIYVYLIGCVSTGTMVIYRQYYYLTCGGSPTYQYCPCGCNPGTANFGESQAGPIAVTCGSISWSGSLTPPSGVPLADPVGGTVSFHQ